MLYEFMIISNDLSFPFRKFVALSQRMLSQINVMLLTVLESLVWLWVFDSVLSSALSSTT
jgi:hypothetical protein